MQDSKNRAESSLPKRYDPSGVEQRWYALWEKTGQFLPGPESGSGAYCIMIPPPNVTGTLHMGHAFQDTLMDALIRQRRMRGVRTLWQTGTDHAGIATQMVVERQLNVAGQTRHDLGREPFIERVWQWREHSGGTIVRQLRRLGASCDWSRERFTMDREMSHAVREVFVRLYDEGLIYRGKRLVNWDPVLHTAVSDLEVIAEEEPGHLWHIRYPLVDRADFLVVATTRPETMLGDSAVAVHPEDGRYRHLVGQEVVLPLSRRRIPVIRDTYVDPAFGSGCVKITPAHDFNDYEVGQRHDLPIINIFTPDARINENGPQPYRGLDRYEARKQIVADLESAGLMDKITPHRLMIPRGDRTQAVVEPYLTDQWFVRAAPLAEEAVRAVEQGRIRFVPDNWKKTYFEWMNNIQDWCISRQIWWGHQIPAWYGPDGHIFVCNCEEAVYELAAEHYGHPVQLTRDPDVLDTWFSSALWPFSTLGWPKNTPELKAFYPTDVLVTGFDIIFFWVARMIMVGLKFTGEVPFREVYITGLVKDSQGDKMSKSKGNILDPLDLIDGIDLESLVTKRTQDLMQPHLARKIEADTRKEFPHGIPSFGADALRFTMASLATQGRDVRFDLGRIEGNRNFCNKLWNAARFVLMNTATHPCTIDGVATFRSMPDRWIRSRLQRAIEKTDRGFEKYRFDEVVNAIYHFLWDDFCDWYLEVVKPVLYGTGVSDNQKMVVRHTMVTVLETALRLLHPIMPFITEELWQKVSPLATPGAGSTLLRAPWPKMDATARDDAAEAEMALVQELITAVRTIRGEMNIAPGKRLPLLVSGETTHLECLERYLDLIMPLARIESWHRLEGPPSPGCATAVLTGIRLFIPVVVAVDLVAEASRLEKGLERVRDDLTKVGHKLANPNFLAKAKPEVVAAVQAKERVLQEKRQGLDAALQRLTELAKSS